MLKPFLIVPVLALLSTPALLQQKNSPPAAAPSPSASGSAQGQFHIPPEYVGKVNPVTPTPESQERAKKIYGWDCAMCHSDNGDGKGDVAAEQKLTVPDFRIPDTLKHYSDGELFYIIQSGKGQMPGDSARTKPDEIWNLVIYVRKMSGSQSASTAPPAQ